MVSCCIAYKIFYILLGDENQRGFSLCQHFSLFHDIQQALGQDGEGRLAKFLNIFNILLLNDPVNLQKI
jgi:hypothetical protein